MKNKSLQQVEPPRIYNAIQRPDANPPTPPPRCLASLPHNIEELVKEFKMQENNLS